MGKLHLLIAQIALGFIVAANFVTCIISTDARVLVPVNLAMAGISLAIFLLLRSYVSGLARDLGIPRKDAGALVGDYFAYYTKVEKISFDDYLKRS